MLKNLLITSILTIVLSPLVWATDDTIKVVPGNYSITTTSRSNLNTNPQIETDDQCIKKESAGVKEFLLDDENCSSSNVKKSGNSLSFDVKCSGEQMPTMTGTAKISATSSTVKTHYKIAGSFQGQEISVDIKSEGKLTGPCN